MNMNDYLKRLDGMGCDKSPASLEYYMLGLVGEAGEAAEHVKKSLRLGEYNKPLDKYKLILELGDVLWYLTKIADKIGFTLEEVARFNIEKLADRYQADLSRYKDISRFNEIRARDL